MENDLYNSIEYSLTYIGMFLKKVREISGNSLLTGAWGLLPTVCSFTKNKLLIEFFKDLKILENFHEEICNGVPF